MDDPKQLINSFVEELWNERRLEVADAIFAKDCVTHQLRSACQLMQCRAAHRRSRSMLWAGLPASPISASASNRC